MKKPTVVDEHRQIGGGVLHFDADAERVGPSVGVVVGEGQLPHCDVARVHDAAWGLI